MISAPVVFALVASLVVLLASAFVAIKRAAKHNDHHERIDAPAIESATPSPVADAALLAEAFEPEPVAVPGETPKPARRKSATPKKPVRKETTGAKRPVKKR